MKKQFAALLALSTAAACVLSYQPVQAGAESVLQQDHQGIAVQRQRLHLCQLQDQAVLHSGIRVHFRKG